MQRCHWVHERLGALKLCHLFISRVGLAVHLGARGGRTDDQHYSGPGKLRMRKCTNSRWTSTHNRDRGGKRFPGAKPRLYLEAEVDPWALKPEHLARSHKRLRFSELQRSMHENAVA